MISSFFPVLRYSVVTPDDKVDAILFDSTTNTQMHMCMYTCARTQVDHIHKWVSPTPKRKLELSSIIDIPLVWSSTLWLSLQLAGTCGANDGMEQWSTGPWSIQLQLRKALTYVAYPHLVFLWVKQAGLRLTTSNVWGCIPSNLLLSYWDPSLYSNHYPIIRQLR